MRRVIVAALLLAAAPSARAAPARPGCRGSLSGAVTANFACEVSVTATDDGRAVLVIAATTKLDDVPSYVPGAFELPSPVEARTYTLDTLGMGKASVAAQDGVLYTATKTSSQRGEVTLSLTRVKKDRRVKGAYDVRGSYRAKLIPAGGGKAGEVVVEAKF